jgi:2-polyprenyl-6-methoxyphenol hydroxylase-like FAD-dependent oxidoreductase
VSARGVSGTLRQANDVYRNILPNPIVAIGATIMTEGWPMFSNGLRVRIVGAGTGGLCLAQGLKRDDIDVEVYERDHSPSDRLQGYRLSINATGRRALKECLPHELFEKLIENSAKQSQRVTFLDHCLNRLLVIDLPHGDRDNPDSELPVSRISLRSILSEGLGDVIRYGKKFVAFEDAGRGTIAARFEDGTYTTGDVLVGADGAGSHLRVQLLPDARRIETGIVAVSGKLSLSSEVRGVTPQPILQGPTLILGPKGCFMFASTVDYEGDTAGAERHYDRESYVMWGFSAHDETLGLPDLAAPSGQAARAAVIALTDGWHPAVRWLVENADLSTVTAFAIKTSVPIQPWATRRVTLLGDALHNMTPFRGIGANTALRDAAALRRALVGVARGRADLIQALAAYERGMIGYGFAAVQTSLKNMDRFHAKGVLARGAVKCLFRAIDHLPPLKAAFLAQ